MGNQYYRKQLNFSYFLLTGEVPKEIGNLTALTYLDLAYNQLTGSIPSKIGQLKALKILTLSGNHLTQVKAFKDDMEEKVPGCDVFVDED